MARTLLYPASSATHPHPQHPHNTMLNWSITFFLVAIVAAVFGFGGISESAVDIARVLFGVFIVLFVVSLLFGRKKIVVT